MLARSSVFDGKTELAPPAAKRKRLSLGDIPSRRSDGDTDFEKNEVMPHCKGVAKNPFVDLQIFGA